MNRGGRPQKYDRIKEAEDLIKWAQKEDSLNLIKFTLPKAYTYEMMLQWVRDDEQFSQAYEKAREILACRRDEAVHAGKYNQKVFDRWSTIYDKQLYRHERKKSKDKVEDELELKKADAVNLSEQAVAFNESVMEKLDNLQKQRDQPLSKESK